MSTSRLIVLPVVFTGSVACGDAVIPLVQMRFVSAETVAECEGSLAVSVFADDFGPFDESVQSLQICDEVGTIAIAEAEQSSTIGEQVLSAQGAASAGGEGPGGIHAFSSSVYDLEFAIEIPCRYRVTGEVTVRNGLPGGHQAFVRLLGAGDIPVFNDGLVGDGGPLQSLPIDRSGVLIDGPYNLNASALVSPADLLEQIPFPETSYSMHFEIYDLGDINVDGVVGINDLLQLLGSWGTCPDPPQACPADTNLDGVVDVLDLLVVLGQWSP